MSVKKWIFVVIATYAFSIFAHFYLCPDGLDMDFGIEHASTNNEKIITLLTILFLNIIILTFKVEQVIRAIKDNERGNCCN